jgi:5-methyltetrahydrofolate--homocysteine methyltransferase
MSEDVDTRLDAIYEAVLGFDAPRTAELVRQEIRHGADCQRILSDALIAAMDEVGDQFAEGRLFVPEMLMAAKAMKAGLEVLRPLLSAADVKPIGTVLIGTVHKDLHDIGKNLVGMMMEGGGLKVIDLGVDVPPDRFLAAAHEHKPDVIGLSALLTTTMPNMRKTVELLRGVGYNGRIIVGGAPVNAAFAEAIGADGYADDAPGAVRLARQLIVAAER